MKKINILGLSSSSNSEFTEVFFEILEEYPTYTKIVDTLELQLPGSYNLNNQNLLTYNIIQILQQEGIDIPQEATAPTSEELAAVFVVKEMPQFLQPIYQGDN